MKAIILLVLLAASCGPDDSVPMPEHGWESIGGGSKRLEVPGGWIVRYATSHGAGVTFVPDQNKEWRQR